MAVQQITTSKKLVYNTFFNVVTLVSSAVISFFLIRFFLGQLGEKRYGVWLLVGDLIFRYGGLLSVGLNSAINRYIPVYLAKDNEKRIQQVVSTSLFFFLIMAIVLAVATVVTYYNIDSWFALEPELARVAGIVLLLVWFSFALVMPLQISSGILSGLQRYDIINIATLIPLIVRTILLVLLLQRGYGLITMGLIFGLSEIVVRLLQVSFVRRLLPEVSLTLAHIDFTLLKEMLAYGINTFLYAMGIVIISYASNLIIGIFIGVAQISQFSTATAGVLLLAHLLQAFTAAIKPAVSDLDARNDHTRVKEISFLTQKYSLLLAVPATCFFVAMGREFLTVWVGEKFQDPAIINSMSVILTIVAVGSCIGLAQHSNFLVLVGRGEHRVFGILMAITAFLCVLSSVISVKVLDWGLVGIAWSNFFPVALTSGVVLPIYFNWKMKISARESILRVWWPALLGCLPGVITISIWKYLSPPDSWIEIFAVVVVSMIVTVSSSWLFALEPIERKRFLNILRLA
jgi:O-antigen/teichoic acid export membrane protein